MNPQNEVGSMLALKLYPDPLELRFESIDIPQIVHSDDAIVKLAGLCGSDLHAYRELETFDTPYVTGHEFVGKIVALGDSFGSDSEPSRAKLYSTLKIGDKVVSPFTSSCGECRACRTGFSSRCKHSLLFGSPRLPGAQAQYIRVPHAGGTLFKFPPDDAPSSEITTWDRVSDTSLILLGDILPTGYFAALQAVQHPNLAYAFGGKPFPTASTILNAITVDTSITKVREEDSSLTLAVVGLGPVGLCALVSLVELLGLSGISNFAILAIDPNASRRKKAEAILMALGAVPGGAIRVVSSDDAVDVADELSGSYGCDAVLEVVGNNSAIQLAYDLIRPFGVISSVGVHTHPQFPINGDALYSKNVSLAFGRCPVRSIFPYCVELLRSRQDIFSVGGEASMIEKVVPFEEESAKEAYNLFNEGKCGKILFRMASD
ncbi:alcohol dehydrogenase [Ceratobasidium sp. AG-I]|nr:alcohol dehydrogenase [Ceratobasidium sp. AG-I]